MKKVLLLMVVWGLIISCSHNPKNMEPSMAQENLVLATIWYQHSPEAMALYFQGFNIARERVAEYSKIKGPKPKAVVVDLDETMIDNSPFQGRMIEEGSPFTIELWDKWVQRKEAKATPGAVDFTHFCRSVGVDVIYLSNRTTDQLEATMQNMQQLGFAFVSPEYFFLKEATSGKEPRRKEVANKYEIVLLLGDNLNDFAEIFENRDENWGKNIAEQQREEFGRRFIAFPNPMYGDWEKNIYGKNRVADEQLRFKLRREVLKTFP